MTSMTTSPRGEGEDGGSILQLALEFAAAVMATPTNQRTQVLDQVDELCRYSQAEGSRVKQNAEEAGDVAALIAAPIVSFARQLRATPTEEVEQAIHTAEGIGNGIATLAAKVLCMHTMPISSVEDIDHIAHKAIYILWDLAVLPPDLARRALIVLGEVAFAPADARLVFASLAGQGYAVYGVERWLPEGAMVQWLGTSDYEQECNQTSTDWPAYVQCCLQGATAFVEWGAEVRDTVFNYTWGWEGEREELEKSIS